MSRQFARSDFERSYSKCVLSKKFFEANNYYSIYKSRYRKTMEFLSQLDLPQHANIVEVGGGQIALLCKDLFGDHVTIWDVNDKYFNSLNADNVETAQYDLLHDSAPPVRDTFDLLVLCEVVEHLPVPLYEILRRIAVSLRPGGQILITTPNIYRLRNVLRLLVGKDIFCNWELPEKGRFLGHVTEFSLRRLEWQIKKAGLTPIRLETTQMSPRGSGPFNTIAKLALLPFSLVPVWRDGLIASCTRGE